jgi:hypothetical protein
MFRIPSLAEILALFFTPKTVAAAVRGIETAAVQADSVVSFNAKQQAKADAARLKAEQRAAEEAERAAVAAAEQERGARVAERLRALVE